MQRLMQNLEWRQLWDERTKSVTDVFGSMVPKGMVVPFSWKQFVLPGACAMTFGPSSGRGHYTYMTLGLTQPNAMNNVVPPWEFGLKAKEQATWPVQLLYDLLTYWLDQKPGIRRGFLLPLTFFRDATRALCAGLADPLDGLDLVGSIRGLYLWDDLEHVRFKVSRGDFGLMVGVAVTEDEIQLARQTTPPHLLLLLKRMQIMQLSDPLRESVMTLPGAEREWERIRAMSHDQAVTALDS
jgi:hypothetical protein